MDHISPPIFPKRNLHYPPRGRGLRSRWRRTSKNPRGTVRVVHPFVDARYPNSHFALPPSWRLDLSHHPTRSSLLLREALGDRQPRELHPQRSIQKSAFSNQLQLERFTRTPHPEAIKPTFVSLQHILLSSLFHIPPRPNPRHFIFLIIIFVIPTLFMYSRSPSKKNLTHILERRQSNTYM